MTESSVNQDVRRDVEAALRAGARIEPGLALRLAANPPLTWLGRLAHAARLERHGAVSLIDPTPPPDLDALELRWDGGLPELAAAALELRGRIDSGESGRAVLLRGRVDAAPAEILAAAALARLILDDVDHLALSLDDQSEDAIELGLGFGIDAVVGRAEGADAAELVRRAELRPAERDAEWKVARLLEPPTPLAQRRREPQDVWS